MRWVDAGDVWNMVRDGNDWEPILWSQEREHFRIRCLPQHLPPVKNVVTPDLNTIPRNLPNLAFVGVDWAATKDSTQRADVVYQGSAPLSMTMKKVLTPGIWVICTTAGPEVEVLIVKDATELDTEIPAVRLTTQTHFKTPVEMREPVLPKDFGKTVWWSEPDMATRERPSHSSGRLVGQSDGGKVLIVERGHGTRTTHVRRQYAFIVDQPADGF
jgi:hypothetical protein